MTTPGRCERVLLVTIDSLRADALEEMETVRDIARRGTRFETAFAHGNWTPFSFPSLLGPAPVFSRHEDPRVASPTLAGQLRRRGVATTGVNAANGFLTSHWGYASGFESFEPFVDLDGRVREWLACHPTIQSWVQLVGDTVTRQVRGGDDRHAVDTSRLLAAEDELVDALGGSRSPQFLWLHLMDTHTPYVPAPQYRDMESREPLGGQLLVQQLRTGLGTDVGDRDVGLLRSRYDAAARQVDDCVSRLLDTLEERGLREETCIVVAGDHGEEFMEHGHTAHYPKLYRELIEVPLVIDHPDGVGDTVDRPVGLEVIPPTIAELFGCETERYSGRSVLPAVLEGDSVTPEPVVSVAVRGDSITQQPIPRSPAQGEVLVSVRTDRWTYIHHTESDTRELYDRAVDPGEHDSVWEDHSSDAVASRLHDVAQTRYDEIRRDGRRESTPEESPPETVADRLAHLGYT